MSEETIEGGSIERSFKNKGTVEVRPLPLAPILLVQKSACVGEAGVREVAVADRDLQRKSKSEVGLLRQDPPTLQSVLCLNKNGVLEWRI